MRRTLSTAEAAALPADVVYSVQAVSRALPPPFRPVPPWLARVLPKSGLAGSGDRGDDTAMDDEDGDDEIDDEFEEEESATLHEVSFDLHPGEGMGIVGADRNAITTLVRILIGGMPPTTGRVVFRGHVAPITNRELSRLIGNTSEKKSVTVVGNYFHWPLPVIKSRWAEIEEFAGLHETDDAASNKRVKQRTRRLLISAALHMDATAYVIDSSIHDEPAFGLRCLDLIAQRQREGAVVIQAARMGVEAVAGLCNQVIWLEDGHVTYSGRPVDVAAEVHRHEKAKVAPHLVPVSAVLVTEGDPVQFGEGWGKLDFELHLLRKDIEIGLTLELTDEFGQVVMLRDPQLVEVGEPGIFKLRLGIPPGLLNEPKYHASLIAEIAIVGHEPAPPRELISFDIAVASGRIGGDDEPGNMVLLPIADEGLEASPADVQWDVSRASD